MIIVKNLLKTYGHGTSAVHALKGVDFKVEEGEFVAIMGRSGSGKSTLLRILGLLDLPTGGEISIDGIDALKLHEKDRAKFRLERLGYVFQEHSLIAELNVLENVYLPAVADLARNNYKNRAEEILEIVGLKDRINHYPSEISGGEQQRVAIARALINQPKTLFADEPTASLDEDSSKIVLDLIFKLTKEMKQTIVMVTHEPHDEK
ncbi:MAG: ABC transporter ATP-binding protein, partial [Chloroflexi bacterium]|nr:ABC transporter ATP-binding protein [Chloroflexota bacterium]